MTVETARSLRLTRTVAAPPARVFEAWTTPEDMVHWASPEGATLEKVEVDLRVGGSYLLAMKNAEGAHWTAFGTYKEIDPPNRLVYTWDWKEKDHAMGDTLVTVEFNEVDGGTEVVLVHEGFPAEEAKDGHLQGWTSCLDRFEKLLG